MAAARLGNAIITHHIVLTLLRFGNSQPCVGLSRQEGGSMATKKAAKAQKAKPQALAPVAKTVTPRALAASAPTATPADAKQDAILGCIVKVFGNAGLPHISAPNANIVWQQLNDPADIIDQLGN